MILHLNTFKLLILSLIFLFCHQSFGQPANNNCAGAFSVAVNSGGTCSTTFTATSVGATQSQAACSGSGADDDVWFSFTASATTHTVTVTPGTMSDVVLQVFSGTCAGLTSVVCRDATSGATAEIAQLTGLTIGNVYFYRVHSYSNGSNAGTFTSCITSPPPPPANDNCAGATALPCGTSNLSGTTVGAVSETAPSGCASAFGVWYTFTGNGQNTTISSAAASGFDHEIDVFSGSCGSLTNITCTDGAGSGGTENYTFLSVNGTTYYVYVAYYTSGTTTGTFTISRTCTAPPVAPANDNCSGATALPCGTNNLAGTTVGAVSETAPSGCASAFGVWYTFTGNGQSTTISSTAASGFDHEIDIFSGSCGSLTNIACVDGPGAGGTENYTFTSVNGTTYYIYVAYYTTGATTGTFTISRTCSAPPANDDCTGAYTVTVNAGTTCTTQTGGTLNAATASAQTTTCNATYDDDDVWYSFLATSTTHSLSLNSVAGNNTDLYHSVYSGSCGSISAPIVCEDNNSSLLSGLTIGTTYFIRVYTYGTTTGANTTFSVCVTTPPDPCATTTNVASCGSSISTSFAAGTGLYGTSACGFTTGGYEKIFTFTPATTGNYLIQQVSSFAYIDYQYKAVSAGCSNTGWTCIDDISGSGTSVSAMALTAGVQYYILLDPESTAGGNVTFNIVCPPTPPANDNCTGAYNVTPNAGLTCSSLVGGTIYGATASTQTNTCGGTADDDVWYSFVATSTSHSITLNNVAGSTTDLYHSVYSGTCGAIGSPIACSDPNTSAVYGLTVGQTYYIRVYSWTSTIGQTTTFSVCITTPPPTGACGNPTTNDFCSNPATLTQGVGTFSSTTASIYTADQTQLDFGVFCGSIENNSWYSFIATSTTATFPITSVSGCTSGWGIQAQVFSVTTTSIGCCNAFSSVSNCYNPGNTSTGTVTATGLTAGNTYILMIDGNSGDACSFSIANWTATGILPIDLMNFVGHNEAEKNKIQWVTSSEKNSNYFRVEKSKDGINFEKLLDNNAAGNSQSPKYYNVFDLNPFEEITYYRLKLYHNDGSFEYSNIISINNSNLTDYISATRPNPTNGDIEFDVNMIQKGNILIEIYNHNGGLIHSNQHILNPGYQSLNLDLNKYDSGIYLLKVSFGNSGKTEIQKIIKN